MLKDCSESDGCGVHWYALTGKNWWQIEIQDLKFESTSFFSSTTTKAIVDSGTSMITVPTADFNKFKAILDSSYGNENIYC